MLGVTVKLFNTLFLRCAFSYSQDLHATLSVACKSIIILLEQFLLLSCQMLSGKDSQSARLASGVTTQVMLDVLHHLHGNSKALCTRRRVNLFEVFCFFFKMASRKSI